MKAVIEELHLHITWMSLFTQAKDFKMVDKCLLREFSEKKEVQNQMLLFISPFLLLVASISNVA